MTEQTSLYFIVRTDVSGTSGQQRGYGVFDDEAEAWGEANRIGNQHPGKFEVFEGESKGELTRAFAPLKFTPKQRTRKI